MEPDEMGMDIGPKTREIFADAVSPQRPLYGTDRWAYSRCRTSQKERIAVAEALADIDATTIIGGGEFRSGR